MKTKITATHTPEAPHVGQKCTVYGVECEITAVHPFGTIDVAALHVDRAWRITGLAFIQP